MQMWRIPGCWQSASCSECSAAAAWVVRLHRSEQVTLSVTMVMAYFAHLQFTAHALSV